MSDDLPITSGKDLILSTRGILERLGAGEQVRSIVGKLLKQLEDKDGEMGDRAPEALANCRQRVWKQIQDDDHFHKKLEAAGAPEDVHPEQRHVHMVIPPDPVHCLSTDCGWRGHRREAPDGVCPDDGGVLADG